MSSSCKADKAKRANICKQEVWSQPIQRKMLVQTDNGTEFTYKYISEIEDSPLDKLLKELNIPHKLIPPRTPWQNGKVERGHRNDQRYFYDWEKFISVEDLNRKLSKHQAQSNWKQIIDYISILAVCTLTEDTVKFRIT